MSRFIAVLIVCGSVSLFACGGDDDPDSGCGPTNCSGCCSGGVCQAGSSTNACGTGGGACTSCSSGLSCIAGACQQGTSGCSASTCTGCCLNNACQSGNTAAGCGKNGTACVACANNQICRTDQTCGVDPSSNWRVQPVSASIAPNNNGSAWDGDASAPDVVVAMICPPATSQNGRTPEVQSYTPTWSTGGCTAKASDLLTAPWTFQLIDVDVLSDDTITGGLAYQFKESDFVTGQVTFQASGGMQSMTVELQRQ